MSPDGKNVAVGDLITFAYTNGAEATQRLSRDDQKRLGQFITPPTVAQFMAVRALPDEALRRVNVLDPAAGTGILAAAAVGALLSRADPPDQINVKLFEIDERLVPALRRLADRMRRSGKARGVKVSASIVCCDFLFSPFARARKPGADVIIANPPISS